MVLIYISCKNTMIKSSQQEAQSFEHHAQLDYFLYALTLVAILL